MDEIKTITVADAVNRQHELERLANNMRLLNQYFLNVSSDDLEHIADKHGMNDTVLNIMDKAVNELYALAKYVESTVQNTPMPNTAYPISKPSN